MTDAKEAKPKTTWYINEWMVHFNLTGRGAQARLERMMGWSKAKASDLRSGKTPFNAGVLAELSEKWGIEPYELLMHPDAALSIRRLRESAAKIVEDTPPSLPPSSPSTPAPPQKIWDSRFSKDTKQGETSKRKGAANA